MDKEKGNVKWAKYVDGNKKTYSLQEMKDEVCGMALRCDFLIKENKALREIIEADDKLFQDCEDSENRPEWKCQNCVSDCKGCDDCQ